MRFARFGANIISLRRSRNITPRTARHITFRAAENITISHSLQSQVLFSVIFACGECYCFAVISGFAGCYALRAFWGEYHITAAQPQYHAAHRAAYHFPRSGKYHNFPFLAYASAFFSDIRLRRTLLLRSDIRLRRVILPSAVLDANIISLSLSAQRKISLLRSKNITVRPANNITITAAQPQSHIRHICTECPVAGTNRSVTSAVRSFIYPVVVPSLHP